MGDEVTAYYNQLARNYDEDRFGNTYGKYIHKQEKEFLIQHLSGKTTLNMGCGTGRFMEYALYGLDISNQMLNVAEEKFPSKSFCHGDADNTPFEKHFFDDIFCLHVLMHLPQQKMLSVLDESYRILKSGGSLIVDFPSARRRKLLGFHKQDWHGASAYTIDQLKILTNPQWTIKQYSGILFLPIHRIPKSIRKFLISIDSWLCRSFFKDYASYMIVVLEKR
jgi:ubiquinone/menaquinone biosynthesis C-methylase UbiE